MSRRLVVEVELLDTNDTWQDDELADLAERIRKDLLWHAIPRDNHAHLIKVTARKG
jgi:hypothetical protein